MISQLLRLILALVLTCLPSVLIANDPATPEICVMKTSNFQVTGDGSNRAWQRADWIPLNPRDGASHDYVSRFKALYSETGIYFLFNGTDMVLTASMQKDFQDLWKEDVFEVFLWPDEAHPVYFEYEIRYQDRVGKSSGLFVGRVKNNAMLIRPVVYVGASQTAKRRLR